MANDWIKFRSGLFESPKLIGMAKYLARSISFLNWITPEVCEVCGDNVTSEKALRMVTGALLSVTWSRLRQFGKALPNGDCYLEYLSLSDLDGIAGAPDVGAAMEFVGWAQYSEELQGVIIPKFFLEHNVALSSAEKQSAYRERKSTQKRTEKRYESVTKALPTGGNKTVTRVEESRVLEEVVEKVEKLFQPEIIFKCNGKEKCWSLTEQFLATAREAFPALPVLEIIRGAWFWTENNPDRRKTAKGMPRFLSNWIANENNNAPKANLPRSRPVKTTPVDAEDFLRNKLMEIQS